MKFLGRAISGLVLFSVTVGLLGLGAWRLYTAIEETGDRVNAVFYLEQAANRYWPLLIVQLAAFAYLLAYLVLSVHRVYRASWLATSAKTLGVMLGYLALIGLSFEAASHLSLPESGGLPIVTD